MKSLIFFVLFAISVCQLGVVAAEEDGVRVAGPVGSGKPDFDANNRKLEPDIPRKR